MEVGYFKQCKKLWLNRLRLDMNDMWDLINQNENITLWCIEVPIPATRSQLDTTAAVYAKTNGSTQYVRTI